MNHSGVLSIIVFSLGYLTGISLVFEPALYLKFAGCLAISYFTFLLVSEIEEKK